MRLNTKPVRKELSKLNGKRIKCIATVNRFGFKNAYKGPPLRTVCFGEVKLHGTGQVLTDHVWMTVGKRIDALDLAEGDTVVFEARVSRYVKGYVNYREYIDNRQIDYRLSYISKVEKLVNEPNQELKLEL